jgi:phosphoribosyl 1,2-cyclic phosphate phosphodiesterase
VKALILGCGTSAGVPRIGNDWGACDPLNPKNRRTRVSVLVQPGNGQNILIDTSPDLRQQFLQNNIASLETVIWTHDHADHCHGIDDLRAVFHKTGKPLKGYGRDYTIDSLKQRFSYIFDGNKGYPTVVEPIVLSDDNVIAQCRVRIADQPHGPVLSSGIRIDYKGRSIVYATDFSEISDEMRQLYQDCDVLIVDCLREERHPTHAHLDMALELSETCNAGQTILTHMDKSLDYETLHASLPDTVHPGYDGLCVVAAMR